MSHVFISYASDDKRKRQLLVHKLESFGVRCWYDKRDIEHGKRWIEKIDQGLEEAFAVLVIVTENALKSHFVTYEIAYACGLGLTVIPLRYDTTIIDNHPLAHMQWEKYSPQIFIELVPKLQNLEEEFLIFDLVKEEVNDSVFPLIPIVHFSLWVLTHWLDRKTRESTDIGAKDVAFIVQKAGDTAIAVLKNLRQLWLRSSSAFTSKQRRDYHKVVKLIKIFHIELKELTSTIHNPFGISLISPQLRKVQDDNAQYILQKVQSLQQLLSELINSNIDAYNSFHQLDEMLQDVSARQLNAEQLADSETKNLLLALTQDTFKQSLSGAEVDKAFELVVKLVGALNRTT